MQQIEQKQQHVHNTKIVSLCATTGYSMVGNNCRGCSTLFIASLSSSIVVYTLNGGRKSYVLLQRRTVTLAVCSNIPYVQVPAELTSEQGCNLLP